MSNHHTTVFLFLIDKKGVPRFGSEKYLCSLIETPQRRNSFSPASLTHDNKENRSNIIRLIEELSNDSDPGIGSIRNIGDAVLGDLGLVRILRRIVSNNDEVTFVTNDPAIPWEWASADTQPSICEQISCGNVFFEQLAQTVQEARTRKTWDTFDEYVSRTEALLLFDRGGHNGLDKLDGTEAEVLAIKTALIGCGLSESHVRIVDGNDRHAEPTFLREVRRMGENLGIIHYAGHILNGDIRLRHSAIEQKEIYENFPDDCLPKPLVFINGCESGSIRDVWEKSKNLSTAWLAAGALAVVACRLAVLDSKAQEFASKFYSNILAKKHSGRSLGTVLKDTRIELMKTNPDVSWLQYTLIGHPHLRLFEPTRTEAEVAATLMDAKAPPKLAELMAQ